jgi:hypothetical protein
MEKPSKTGTEGDEGGKTVDQGVKNLQRFSFQATFFSILFSSKPGKFIDLLRNIKFARIFNGFS